MIAAGASLAPTIAAAGFRHAPMGPALIGDVVARMPELAGLTGRERARATMRKVFAEVIAPAMADGITALAESWRPDVIVNEDREFGSWVAAERLGIPYVTVQTTAWRTSTIDITTEPLNALRERYGLARDERLAGLYRYLFLTTRPLSLRDPGVPYPEVTAELRPIADDWLAGDTPAVRESFPPRDSRPRVAITLGTVNNSQHGILRAFVDGAVAAGAHIVVALGADPGTLGDVPPGVAVHAYVPMSTLLPEADVLAFHGGSGTMLAALAAGIPMVIVPIAADQPDNAELCAAAGVASVIPLETIDAATAQAAIEAVLADPSYRHRAREVADEVATMPGPDAAFDRIESIILAHTSIGGTSR